MNFREVLNQVLGEPTSEVLGIYQYIPPQIQCEGTVFDINVNLFKGEAQEWFSYNRWRESFSPENIKDESRPARSRFETAYSKMECEFFSTKYYLYEESDFHGTIYIVASNGFMISINRFSFKREYEYDIRFSKSFQEVFVKPPQGSSADFRRMLTSFMDSRFESYEREEFVQFKLKSDVRDLLYRAKLLYRLKLTYFIDQQGTYESDCPQKTLSFECISSQKFRVAGQVKGGNISVKIDSHVNSKKPHANSREEILDEIRNKSILYKFFILVS